MANFIRHKSFINFPILLRVIGWLLMIEAAFMLIPMIVGFLYKEQTSLSFLISVGITAVGGFSLMSLRYRNRDMGKRRRCC